MINRIAWLVMFLLLLLEACESAEDQVARLQRELLATLNEREYFEFVLDGRPLRWKLPPTQELADSRVAKIQKLQAAAQKLSLKSAETAIQTNLQQLNMQLNQLLLSGNGAYFDPASLVISELLDEKIDPKTARALLPKIPAYYAEVERRWINPEPQRAKLAAQQSISILEALDKMGNEALPAQFAVKDFIGLCQSAALTQ